MKPITVTAIATFSLVFGLVAGATITGFYSWKAAAGLACCALIGLGGEAAKARWGST